jgi:uncharacterized protein YbbK (DUF523 family)
LGNKPKIGISRCLLGENVRYDGGHTFLENLNTFINEDDFEIYGICPEVEMGLGIPRETIQLVEIDGDVRLINSARTNDLTDLANETFKKFEISTCDGFILQSRSPSCGVMSSKLYQKRSDGEEVLVNENTSGLFAGFLKREYPEVPLLDSSKFAEDIESFLRQVRNYHQK